MGQSLYRQNFFLSSADTNTITLIIGTKFMLFRFLLLCCLAWSQYHLHADDVWTARFPSPYSDFQIVPGSISHDEKFAVILRDTVNGEEPSKNYIVALSPFRVVTELPTDAIFIEGSRSGGLNVNWNKDDSAAVIVKEGKFGPEKVFVLTLEREKVVKIIDLLSVLQRFVEPDFKKSGADPFNDNFEYFIDEDGVWAFTPSNQIIIDCEFTNDPRLSARVNWTGRFSGKWDLRSGHLIDPHFTRTSTSR